MQNPKPALTCVDAIVAAICTVTIATLALPLLNSLRAQGRTDECSDRLRQIALAAHNYHDANRRLPPATIAYPYCDEAKWNRKGTDVYWKNVQNTSSLALLMPFLDMNDAYDSVLLIAFDAETSLVDYPNPGDTKYEFFGEIPGTINAAIARSPEESFTNMDLFTCPDDNINEDELKVYVTSQPFLNNRLGIQKWPGQGREGVTEEQQDSEASRFWRTNYLACGGTAFGDDPEHDKWKGCMTSGERMTLETVADGTARTIMYAETLGQIKDAERTAAFCWFWGGLAIARGDLEFMQPPVDGSMQTQLIGNFRFSSQHGFGSKHEKGLVTAFADGSIHVLSRRINWMTWYELCGSQDGGR